MKVIFVLILSFLPFSSFADQWCEGKINRVWIGHTGAVMAHSSYRNGHTKMCSLSSEWQNINQDTCKGWLSLLQVAYTTQKDVVVFYEHDTACNELPVYSSSVRPSYVMLK